MAVGDSGAWVIDKQRGDVYGYVTCASEFGDVIVIPMRSALADIAERFSAVCARLLWETEVSTAKDDLALEIESAMVSVPELPELIAERYRELLQASPELAMISESNTAANPPADMTSTDETLVQTNPNFAIPIEREGEDTTERNPYRLVSSTHDGVVLTRPSPSSYEGSYYEKLAKPSTRTRETSIPYAYSAPHPHSIIFAPPIPHLPSIPMLREEHTVKVDSRKVNSTNKDMKKR